MVATYPRNDLDDRHDEADSADRNDGDQGQRGSAGHARSAPPEVCNRAMTTALFPTALFRTVTLPASTGPTRPDPTGPRRLSGAVSSRLQGRATSVPKSCSRRYLHRWARWVMWTAKSWVVWSVVGLTGALVSGGVMSIRGPR